jgi:hypothetical protein
VFYGWVHSRVDVTDVVFFTLIKSFIGSEEWSVGLIAYLMYYLHEDGNFF